VQPARLSTLQGVSSGHPFIPFRFYYLASTQDSDIVRQVIELKNVNSQRDPIKMLDISLRQVISTKTNQFKPYDRYGDSVAGMSWIPLSGELRNGEFECFVLQMEAGSESKPHEHMGFEEFLILDGEMIDCDGTHYRSGDFVRLLPGSKHSSHTLNGCTLLVMLRGNNRALRADEIS
jgi:quercetin dioxygenase-like cupin family protein